MISETRVSQLQKALADMAKDKLAPAEAEALTAFMKMFYRSSSSPDDLLERDEAELFSIAHRMWAFSANRTSGDPSLLILNPREASENWVSRNTVLMVVNDDMPFLVDSITGTLSSIMHHRILMMHHPIIAVERDERGNRTDVKADGVRESYMFIEIGAQTDKDALLELEETLQTTLRDVRASVVDWRGMLAKIDETVASLTVNPPPMPQDDVDETIRFLRWLGADHFTFLGFREYRFEGEGDDFSFSQVSGSGLGILKNSKRNVLRDKNGLTPMSAEIRHFLSTPDPLIITKANVKSTVHRNVHMDYIGVKIFDETGKAIGERRFVGLFTSLSYSQFAHDVPMLRNKVARIKARASFSERSYAGKAIAHILETFPRDELFQVDESLMFETAAGVLQLLERPRPKAFVRQDMFERFVSALIYVPRENYHSGLRISIANILCDAYHGEVSVYYAKLSEEPLARWHFIIRTKPGEVPKVSISDINTKIAEATQGWGDRLQATLGERLGEERGNRLHHIYKTRFSEAYKESFSPLQAAYDVIKLDDLSGKDELRVDFYRHLADGKDGYRLKIYNGCKLIALSSCMPILENMGFRVLSEHSYKMSGGATSVIHDFALERVIEEDLSFDELKPLVETLFMQVWHGVAEDDDFNELVLTAGLSWNEIIVIRSYGKYLRQLGLGYTPEYIANTMVEHADKAEQLMCLFEARLDPSLTSAQRLKKAADISASIRKSLDSVRSLDHDRILRAYLNVIEATLRTNFYQPGVVDGGDERALAFKIRSRDVEEAPLPRPYAEIWVYSPQVEGVHLRGGPVARGGLRWSDRREDFRTEVLGLVKAQQVKNAVIVPQGAKGGFFPKRLPPMSDREAFTAEGVASYRRFITSLLSLTDNLKGKKVVPPENMVRHDGDDPYLVVAADKGTATFSDIANSISEDRGFWLGDAFASGGSQGYDHKKMGITAKGAWVSVQRHFREMDIDTQKDVISVIGVGDMSGDVFGNGLLLSKTLHLKAAFNHLHIFLDPAPGDVLAAWKERKRMFNMPRSSWADYNAKLISKGGGIFERSAKSIPLSDEIKAWIGVEEDSLPPNKLLKLILKAEADLLWFGGIGTYVRASTESDAQVGDRANDALRVTGAELRVKVVGEGGNLGMTQRSRIEYARCGGRSNTDFIDNSAGVDCSDKEVNIKILLQQVIAEKKLDREARNSLLESMTDAVGKIVLSDNYLQTQAISLAEQQAVNNREYHLGLIRTLERDGNLNREIEYLPSDDGFAEMAANDMGLTRPEISTLMAYAKMSLFDTLIKGTLVDDPYLKPELEWGFPTALTDKYGPELEAHRLRRDIVATVLANEVVNWAGLTFVYEIKEETGLGVEDIVAAFVVVRDVFGLQEKWEGINALDLKVASSVQYDMHQSLSDSLKAQVSWLLRNVDRPFNVSALVERFKEPFKKLFAIKPDVLSDPAEQFYEARKVELQENKVPKELASFTAAFDVLRSGPDIIAVAEESGKAVDYVAQVHFALGDRLGFDWLKQRSDRVVVEDHWDMLAVRSIMEDLSDLQRGHVVRVCKGAGSKSALKAVEEWAKSQATPIIRAERLIEDLSSSGGLTVAKLSFAARHLRSILR